MPMKRTPELRFDLDFSSQSPAITSATVGIERVSQDGPAALHREITVFDTTDERLLRAGAVVAHRMVDGVGEWYLSAPSWQPRLPAERVEPLGPSGGLPDDFSRMIRPITRGASLGPVASLDCDRREYVLQSEAGDTLGRIVDEKWKVRRNESTTSAYRQVTVLPEAMMTSAQADHIIDSIAEVGGSEVDEFPRLQKRLGPPATGLTDFPAPRPLGRNATMEELVSAVFAADLWALTSQVLDVGRDRRPHVAALNAQLESVSRDLRGLAHVIEPAWREQVGNLLVGVPLENLDDAVSVSLEVAEALVCEARAPKLGDVGLMEAGPLLLDRARQAAVIMVDRCGALTVGSNEQSWASALAAGEMLAVSASVAEPVLGKRLRRIVRRIHSITEHLRACSGHWDAAPSDLDGLTAQEAFTLGRQVERGRATTLTERGRFVALWPDRLDELRRLLSKTKGV